MKNFRNNNNIFILIYLGLFILAILTLLLLIIFQPKDSQTETTNSTKQEPVENITDDSRPQLGQINNGLLENDLDEFLPVKKQEKIMYVVSPHPGDEFQAWSYIENTPKIHKVFLMLTKGEQSAYCDKPASNKLVGVKQPNPRPKGRWSPSCQQARINSFFNFLTKMGEADPGLPSSYNDLGVKGPFLDPNNIVCRKDRDENRCLLDKTVQVWSSKQATVVWFNLGDGDLTVEEVRWAIATVLANKILFGIDNQLSDDGIVGASYYDRTTPASCSGDKHPDHLAVQNALKLSDFNIGWQASAICNADSGVLIKASVSDKSYHQAFGKPPGQALGAFFKNYGWLSNYNGYGHNDDYNGQLANFHRNQTFWIKY